MCCFTVFSVCSCRLRFSSDQSSVSVERSLDVQLVMTVVLALADHCARCSPETAIDGHRGRAAMEKTLQQWFDELIAVNSDGLQQISGAINKILQFRSEKIAAEHQPTPSEEETTSDCDSVMDAVSQEPEPELTTTPPSTDDGFQTVPQKRKPQTSAAQDPTPKKVSGNPPTGTNWRRTAPVPPAPQTQPQEGDPEPARKPRVPPVIIRDSGKWTEKGSASSSPDRTISAPRPASSRTSGLHFTLSPCRRKKVFAWC
ncbi:hypothetical protein GEV33_010453 [Tenebrio molitor]|uniref:Uncharacterized protein n=1 Tax=Tenebrio molitor TaxID=7067 RepID=A0A8J6HD96_TENMO|nr:hypothetical protein GEV33_010453 [Tenebrio molitor]